MKETCMKEMREDAGETWEWYPMNIDHQSVSGNGAEPIRVTYTLLYTTIGALHVEGRVTRAKIERRALQLKSIESNRRGQKKRRDGKNGCWSIVANRLDATRRGYQKQRRREAIESWRQHWREETTRWREAMNDWRRVINERCRVFRTSRESSDWDA